MCWQASQWAKGQLLRLQTPSERLLLMVLAEDARTDTYEVRMSYAILAQICGLTRRHTIRLAQTLIETGLMERSRQGNQHTKPLYKLLVTPATPAHEELVTPGAPAGASAGDTRDTSGQVLVTSEHSAGDIQDTTAPSPPPSPQPHKKPHKTKTKTVTVAEVPEWYKILGRDSRWKELKPEQIDLVNVSFNGLNLPLEAEQALAWLAEPKGQKRKDLWRFWLSWCKRADKALPLTGTKPKAPLTRQQVVIRDKHLYGQSPLTPREIAIWNPKDYPE